MANITWPLHLRTPHVVDDRNHQSGELSVLGCDVSELIRCAFKVIETQQPKLAYSNCDLIVQAAMPSKPIERSYAGVSLLACIVTQVLLPGLPLRSLAFACASTAISIRDVYA